MSNSYLYVKCDKKVTDINLTNDKLEDSNLGISECALSVNVYNETNLNDITFSSYEGLKDYIETLEFESADNIGVVRRSSEDDENDDDDDAKEKVVFKLKIKKKEQNNVVEVQTIAAQYNGLLEVIDLDNMEEIIVFHNNEYIKLEDLLKKRGFDILEYSSQKYENILTFGSGMLIESFSLQNIKQPLFSKRNICVLKNNNTIVILFRLHTTEVITENICSFIISIEKSKININSQVFLSDIDKNVNNTKLNEFNINQDFNTNISISITQLESLIDDEKKTKKPINKECIKEFKEKFFKEEVDEKKRKEEEYNNKIKELKELKDEMAKKEAEHQQKMEEKDAELQQILDDIVPVSNTNTQNRSRSTSGQQGVATMGNDLRPASLIKVDKVSPLKPPAVVHSNQGVAVASPVAEQGGSTSAQSEGVGPNINTTALTNRRDLLELNVANAAATRAREQGLGGTNMNPTVSVAERFAEFKSTDGQGGEGDTPP